MSRSEPEPVRYPRAKRNRSCLCCGEARIRNQIKVGIPSDPDYLVAVCPTCDTMSEEDK